MAPRKASVAGEVVRPSLTSRCSCPLSVLTTSSPDLAASETLQALRTSATLVWQAIFGLHCLILGGAVLRFAPVPRVFGALMLVAGGAYLAIGLGTLSVPAAGDTLMGVGGLLATLGEVPLYVYLLGWAGKVRVGAAATAWGSRN